MTKFAIKDATRQRCTIYKVNPQIAKKFTPISLEFYNYLYQVPKIDFSLFFRLHDELIEYVKPEEFCHKYLKHIWAATQKESTDMEVCVLKKDRRKFDAVINFIRNKKLDDLIAKDNSLDRNTLKVFGDLSGASQMIVRGGINHQVAEKATAAASYMVQNLMNSEAAMGTLSRMITIDPTLYDHSAAVAMFAGLMGTRFAQKPLTEKDAATLAQCGLYHDTGKSCVPSAILNKPGPFTDEEYEVIKTHTHLGSEELARAQKTGAPIDDLVVRVALEHHERFLGHGYPFGKKGRYEDDPENGIHLYSRFVAIADAYSALLMKRVYKPALSSDKAIELMSKNAPKDFDMDIYNSFIGTIQKSMDVLEQRKQELAANPQLALEAAAPLESVKRLEGGALDYSQHGTSRKRAG